MTQLFFHLVFIIVFVGFMGIRAFYYRRVQKQAGPAEFKESAMTRIRRIAGLPFPFLLLAYMLYPALLSFASFGLPIWAQWLGVGLGILSLGLIWWVQAALNLNFSHILHVREQHSLVRHGPYRWVRHPMYTTHFIHGFSILLLTANWLVGGLYLLSFGLIVIFRLRNEEALMLERFGQEYRSYMRSTGRFFPRLP